MLTYMDPDLIVRIKKAALDRQTNLYEIMEEAARTWLETNNMRASRSKTVSKRTRSSKDEGGESS